MKIGTLIMISSCFFISCADQSNNATQKFTSIIANLSVDTLGNGTEFIYLNNLIEGKWTKMYVQYKGDVPPILLVENGSIKPRIEQKNHCLYFANSENYCVAKIPFNLSIIFHNGEVDKNNTMFFNRKNTVFSYKKAKRCSNCPSKYHLTPVNKKSGMLRD